MAAGWIYVLVNDAMPGLVKVGWTGRTPFERLHELSSATAVPLPFRLVYAHYSRNAPALERAVHDSLERQARRVNARREFFQASPVEAVRQAAHFAGLEERRGLAVLADGPEPPAGPAEAEAAFARAAMTGSPIALEQLGTLYAQCAGGSRQSRGFAEKILEEGLRRGNPFCHVPLAGMAASAGRLPDFRRNWNQFFRLQPPPPAGTADYGRFLGALGHYVVGCMTLGVEPWHLTELQAHAGQVAAGLSHALAQADPAGAACHWLKAALRWAGRTLAGEGAGQAGPVPSMRFPVETRSRAFQAERGAWLRKEGGAWRRAPRQMACDSR